MHPRLRLVNMILFFCPPLCFSRLRTALYRACGLRMGAETLICGNLSLSGRPGLFARLTFGQRCFVNAHVHFDLNADVEIGDRVCIGHHVMFITSNHRIGAPDYRCGEGYMRPIRVGDGCWIGANVTLLPGVTLGAGCVVGAGALVTRDVPPNSLVAGVPAKVLRDLTETES